MPVRKLKPVDAAAVTYYDNLSRDPRINPQPGDMVTVAGETRDVETISNGRVYYSWPGKIAVRSLLVSGWQQWAAKATAWAAGDRDEA